MSPRSRILRRVAVPGLAASLLVSACREPAGTAAPAAESPERKKVLEFWSEFRAAEDLRLAGRLDDAIAGYRRALALDPRHEDSLYRLGNALLDGGRDAEADIEFRRLVEVNPHSARGFLQLGELRVDPASPLFDPAAARSEFRRAQEVNREETGAQLGLAEAALLLGEDGEAEQGAERVLVSDPKSRKARLLRGFLKWRKSPRDTALGEDLAAACGAALVVRAEPAGVASEGDTKKGSAGAGANADVRDRGLLADVLRKLEADPSLAKRPAEVFAPLATALAAAQAGAPRATSSAS